MGLTGRLRTWALARPRVLMAGATGTDALRWAAESEVDRRGWVLAPSPADADLLLILGVPGPQLSAAVEVLWGQIPQPRCRVEVIDESRLAGQLDTALRALVLSADRPENVAPQSLAGSADVPMGHGDHPAQGGSDHAAHEAMAHASHGRETPAEPGAAQSVSGDGSEHAEGSAHAAMGHAAHGGDHAEGSGHEAMGHAAHGGDHAGHHMHHGGTVAGLDMAGTGPDRDGLQLDLLGVSLGPVLPGWPTGLLLQARLQGDVVTEARLSWVDAGERMVRPRAAADSRRMALDHLASFLWVAGWFRAAREARQARDGLGSTDPAERALAADRAAKVARRVRHSRSLAWTVRGTGRLAVGAGDDVLERLWRWCAVAAGEQAQARPLTPLDELGSAVTGAELGTVRLIVASVELDRTAPRHDGELAHA